MIRLLRHSYTAEQSIIKVLSQPKNTAAENNH